MDIFQELHDDHQQVAQVIMQLKGRSNVQGKQAAQEIGDLLLPHAKAEEATFYAALQKHDEAKESIDHAIQEHKKIEQHLQQLAKVSMGNEDQVRTHLDQLESVIMDHVEEEEGEVFNQARSLLSRDQLEELSRSFPMKKQELKGQFKMAA